MNARIALAALAATTFLASPVLAVAASGDPVLYWNEVFIGTAWNPGQSRPSALLNIAIHDSVNATLGRPNKPYLGNIVTAGGDTRAAVAVAAHDILVTQYPPRTAEFDAALAGQLALIADGAAKTAGMATGATMAAATLANRSNDGSGALSSYTPSGLPGRWAPTPPGFAPAVAPQQATMQSWLGMQDDAFRVGPPPAIDSVEYATAFALVRDIGSATSVIRTVDQSDAARFWNAASGPSPWIRSAIDIAEMRGFSTLENASKLALLTLGMADSGIAIWDTKYYYDYWRPVTAIRNADLDGNILTDKDATWLPYITTPPHPSYGSAHAAASGAASTILDGWLGTGTGFCLTAASINRCWSDFDTASTEAANSRLWGGIHWDFDNTAGLQIGRDIGAYALASREFAAVPEPATWLMLITGFATIGITTRRRQNRVPQA